MNFRRILSKSSLKSTSSSGKGLSPYEEASKFHDEIESLRQNVQSLKISVESREAAIGILAREKEKLYVELKSAQRTNRNLHQQLIDERDIHSKEKDYLIQEIKRLSKKNEYETNSLRESYYQEEDGIMELREVLKNKDEVICNICSKYLKMKSSKMNLQKKFTKLQAQSQKICENIISLLQENRNTLDGLLIKLLKFAEIPPSSKKYLKLLRSYGNLHYENTQLKVCISSSQNDFFTNDAISSRGNQHNHDHLIMSCYSKSDGKIKCHTKNVKYKKSACSWCKFFNIHSNLSPYTFVHKSLSEPCLSYK